MVSVGSKIRTIGPEECTNFMVNVCNTIVKMHTQKIADKIIAAKGGGNVEKVVDMHKNKVPGKIIADYPDKIAELYITNFDKTLYFTSGTLREEKTLPLHFAVKNCLFHVIEVLLTPSCWDRLINIQDEKGKTCISQQNWGLWCGKWLTMLKREKLNKGIHVYDNSKIEEIIEAKKLIMQSRKNKFVEKSMIVTLALIF